MIVQTIGMTKFGIHSLGFCRLSNQDRPKLTKRVPSPATIKTATHVKIISKLFLKKLLTFLVYVKSFILWLNFFKFCVF